MPSLLIIADDITGALDTGIQFAARGAATRVATGPDVDVSALGGGAQVLVVVAETRHLPPRAAYEMVYGVARRASQAGVAHIYKKTDSALRGNIGAELAAALAGTGRPCLHFLPALPKMNRLTRGGIHYIDGCPVAESVFGRDPFEPVLHSAVAEIIAEQSGVPVFLHGPSSPSSDPGAAGIHVYDAASEADLRQTGERLGPGRLGLSAGCAGFAGVLPDILGLGGNPPSLPPLPAPLFIACASVNPVTLAQMATAEANGFTRVHLAPEQKLDKAWPTSAAGRAAAEGWARAAQKGGRFILDVNDPEGQADTARYAAGHGLSLDDLRVGIAGNLAAIMKNVVESGLEASFLCTGGDLLLALARALGVRELTPLGELAPGVVLSEFTHGGRVRHVISKSGGFGEPGLFVQLAADILA